MPTNKFYTLFWVVYFPLCIAFYDTIPALQYSDELLTLILILYTAGKSKNKGNKHIKKEAGIYISLMVFYVLYSLIMAVNVPSAVWLDFQQQIRPYSIIYCTWILNPQFTRKQKRLMLGTMIVTLFSWITYHPQTLDATTEAEFPVLGQLAICTGMAYYLFTKETSVNRWIALGIVLTGMLAPKFKFMGEVVCFVAMIFFLKKRLNFRSPKTVIYFSLLVTVILFVVWQRFDAYYVTGLSNENMARPMTYKTSLRILYDYFPFGPGMGTFACNAAWRYYSPLYYEYNLNEIWGLNKGGGFICDAFYPVLSQFGIVGVILFCIFWKRRLTAMNAIIDMRYYRAAFLTFFCLAIEQTADSSWLSGKGMGYCMLLALCLNANRNMLLRDRANHKTTVNNETL